MQNPDLDALQKENARLRKLLALRNSTNLSNPGDLNDFASLLEFETSDDHQIATVTNPVDGAKIPWDMAQHRIAAGEFGKGPQALLTQQAEAQHQPQGAISMSDMGSLDDAGLLAVRRGEIQVVR